MAKKVLTQPIKRQICDCLMCDNGVVGAYNLIYCKFCITPQPNRNRYCINYKKREPN